MQSFYVFDFIKTISLQLMEQLEGMGESQLTHEALVELQHYQSEIESSQGVYVVHYCCVPVYVGKAKDVAERLGQHLEKLSGRQRIDLQLVGYKAIYLDRSMSTAANEGILIDMFKLRHSGMWNGGGFGPKDPGVNRDTTEPGQFDSMYPILDGYELNLPTGPDGSIQLKTLLRTMKDQLPYVFRYSVPADEQLRVINLGPDRTARGLLQAVVSFLGGGWHGAVLSYGMVMYNSARDYRYAEKILPVLSGDGQ